VSLASTTQARRPGLLRHRSGVQRVTNIELFFDLVYVYAVTQLSHYLLGHSSVAGALQAGLLLVMVWLLWAYTTWVTNWLDPEQMAVRLLLGWYCKNKLGIARERLRDQILRAGHAMAGSSQ